MQRCLVRVSSVNVPLQGHLASVTAVIANDVDNQIISLSADKQIKLWDIRNHKCIQTTSDREVYTQVGQDGDMGLAAATAYSKHSGRSMMGHRDNGLCPH